MSNEQKISELRQLRAKKKRAGLIFGITGLVSLMACSPFILGGFIGIINAQNSSTPEPAAMPALGGGLVFFGYGYFAVKQGFKLRREAISARQAAEKLTADK